MWADKRPEAHARFLRAREVIAALSEEHDVPAENILQPDALRRCCWEYQEGGQSWIESFLEGRGARAWQISLTAPALAAAFQEAEHDLALQAREASDTEGSAEDE